MRSALKVFDFLGVPFLCSYWRPSNSVCELRFGFFRDVEVSIPVFCSLKCLIEVPVFDCVPNGALVTGWLNGTLCRFRRHFSLDLTEDFEFFHSDLRFHLSLAWLVWFLVSSCRSNLL